MKRFALGAALAGALLAAMPAHAEGPASPTSTVGVEIGTRIDLTLVGSIAPRCALSGGGDINFGELRGGEGAAAGFGLDCNVPFDVEILSARGGLAHAQLPQGQGPFAGLLEYDLRLTVPTLRPTPANVQGNYSSRELRTRRILSSGEGISAGGGTLEFKMRQPEGAGLLAGQYSETLNLTVTPRM